MRRQVLDARGLRLVSLIALVAALAGTAGAAARVEQRGPTWILENGRLRVVVDAQAGALAVTDKAANHEWKQMAK